MDPHVRLEVPLLCEATLADLTLVRFLTSVRPLMNAEPTLPGIRLAADIANEGPLSSVYEQVRA